MENLAAQKLTDALKQAHVNEFKVRVLVSWYDRQDLKTYKGWVIGTKGKRLRVSLIGDAYNLSDGYTMLTPPSFIEHFVAINESTDQVTAAYSIER